MRINNIDIADIFPSVNLAANITGNALDIRSFYMLSLLLIFTGSSPTGTFTFEFSNSNVSRPDDVPSGSWVKDSALDKAITTAGSAILKMDTCPYMWMRVKYAATSGTGTITIAQLCAKGV